MWMLLLIFPAPSIQSIVCFVYIRWTCDWYFNCECVQRVCLRGGCKLVCKQPQLEHKALCRRRSGKPQRLSHGNAHHHFRGQSGGEGCGKRSLWLCVGELECRGGEGSAEGSAWCAHITLDDSRGVQRNSSMQFVGSHNLTSSPKAAC